jgi:sulfide dehydrogenase cytochrome subunit
MLTVRNYVELIAIAALLPLSSPGLADIAGTIKYCTTCHGEDGRGTDADTPIIAGIPAVVQEDAIYAYVDGDRDCGATPMMCKMASKLNEDQVAEVAAYFAAMPFSAAGEDFDAELAKAGESLHKENCAICHGADDPEDAEASILHGQRKGYLRHVLQQYAAGERVQLPAMEKKTSVLSSDDIEALLNYYASYRD